MAEAPRGGRVAVAGAVEGTEGERAAATALAPAGTAAVVRPGPVRDLAGDLEDLREAEPPTEELLAPVRREGAAAGPLCTGEGPADSGEPSAVDPAPEAAAEAAGAEAGKEGEGGEE